MSEKVVTIGGEQSVVSIESDKRRFTVKRAGRTDVIELLSLWGEEAVVAVNGRAARIPFLIRGTEVTFVLEGETYSADVTARGTRSRQRHGEQSMSAPMPGAVLKIFVARGDEVLKGAPLLILEAMKMEHQIVAPYAGTVSAIHCREGELVQPGIDLITLDRKEEQKQ
jgi:3-methylcrotonyl-CoA carboxylase alpha subunit